jgi:hypothetical protein
MILCETLKSIMPITDFQDRIAQTKKPAGMPVGF